jgi:tetratricopeptide (TPR) repeat protein
MKYTWLVEKYLEGELQGKELADFELLILKDPSVAEEVETIRKLNAFCFEQHRKLKGNIGLNVHFNDAEHVPVTDDLTTDMDSLKIRRISDSAAYRDLMRKIRKTFAEASPSKRQAKMLILAKHNFWLTAASFALILALSIFVLSRGLRNPNPLAVYQQFFQPYSPELTIRSNDVSGSDEYLSGLQEYRNANYIAALDLFNAHISRDPGNLPVYLFRGIALMELGDFSQALNSFEQLHSDAIMDEYGRWYSGLCYLQLDRPGEAKKIFRDLVRQKGYFAPQARSVLRLF